jgi:CO dehydrogenase nickel-insertion accessory protein CooC1
MNDDAAVHPPGFLADPTRFLIFTGKGGVGKTSVACAAALAHADNGKSALLVSTDPVRDHYDEGLTIHIDPESCAGGCEAVREALTGE